jgi:signal transduction histidine kinase
VSDGDTPRGSADGDAPRGSADGDAPRGSADDLDFRASADDLDFRGSADDVDLRCSADDPHGLMAEIRRRDRMITALMNQVQRNLNSPDSDFALLQTTFMLEEQVRERTQELQAASHRAEAALERLEAAVGSISEGFALFDSEDRLQLCNDVYRQFWGIGPEAMGKTLEQLLRDLAQIHPTITEVWIARRLANHHVASTASEYRLPDGRHLQVRERRTADGSTVGIYTDITDLAAAQARRLSETVDNIDQGVTKFDADFRLEVWNRRFLELFGYDDDFIRPGLALEAIFRLNAERGEYGAGDVEAMVAERMELARRHEPHRFQRRRPDGSVVEIWGRPVSDGGFVSTYTDVTERINEERAKREKTEQLIQYNADLERFAHVASHDLRTPLRNIVSYAQLLDRRYRGALGSDADDFLGFIVKSAKHMSLLLTDLLEYSLAAGLEQPVAPVSAAAAAARAIVSLSAELDAANARLCIGELPDVIAHKNYLAGLFQHLIDNAVKYRSPDRPPRITIAAEPAEPGFWLFRVADNGIGIDPEYFDKIFDIFQRLHPDSGVDGTGLGLALCRRVVQRFGGRIWVESAPGQGSTFCFLLADGEHAD